MTITPFLAEQPGFISREFGKADDGRYLDVVHCSDASSAHAAAEKVMNSATCGEFFSLINQAQMQFIHFDRLLWAVG